MAVPPSEPLLALLRDVIRKKRLTTAELADKLQVDRAMLKHQLAGKEPLTVDDFIRLSTALELTPQQLGVADLPEPPLTLAAVGEAPEPGREPGPDPLGNLPRQVLELGFALGIDLFLLLDTAQLGDSRVPPPVRARFPDSLPIRLEAKFHRHNKPRFLDDAFECTLSFDALYTCTFPWTAFRQVTFNLPTEQEREAPQPPKPAGPHLRLVK